MNNGIAHISFRGSGMFLPARTPYDREVLAEHVSARARVHGIVQVLVDGRRWMVSAHRAGMTVRCAGCRGSSDLQWVEGATPEPAFCGRCALSGRARRTL